MKNLRKITFMVHAQRNKTVFYECLLKFILLSIHTVGCDDDDDDDDCGYRKYQSDEFIWYKYTISCTAISNVTRLKEIKLRRTGRNEQHKET